MDFVNQLSSCVLDTTLQEECQASMEGYLDDLRSMNAAVEADEGKPNRAAAIVAAIKKFCSDAKTRLLELAGNIIRRLGEIIGTLGNLIHVGNVNAPNEMAEAYKKMADGMEDITANSGTMVNDMTKYLQMYNDSARRAAYTGRMDFADNIRKENDTMKEKVKKIAEYDVLKGRSVKDYIATLEEKNGRTAVINPSQEQRKISAWRMKWQRIRSQLQSTGQLTELSFLTAENNSRNDTEKNALKGVHAQFAQIYNSAMVKVTGALTIISHLQQYISGFVMIARSKVPVNKGTIHEKPAGYLNA